MKRITLALGFAVAMALGTGAMAQQAPADQLVREFRGQAPAQQRTGEQLEADCLKVVQSLLPALGTDAAQQALEAMCHHAARPGAEPQRLALCKAMARCMPAANTPARVWFLRQMTVIGQEEVVECLASLLNDSDAQIRTRAILALANNPAPAAAQTLRSALEQTGDAQKRTALANALGFRRDAESTAILARLLEDANPTVASTAAAALGAIGNEPAGEALVKAMTSADRPEALRQAFTEACLQCAERLALQQKPEAAVKVYSQTYSSASQKRYKLAALRGMLVTLEEDQAIEMVGKLLGVDDIDVQVLVTRAVMEMSGEGGIQVLVQKLPALLPKAQVVAIQALAEKGNAIARPAVIQAIQSSDPAVRMAAVEAMAQLGNAQDVALLATIATSGQAEQAAARNSLARLRGADVDKAILSALLDADTTIRLEMVRAVQNRRPANAVPTLLNLATGDADRSVRAEAINALGKLAGAGQLESLVAMASKPRSPREAEAAEGAIVSIFSRITEPDQRSAAVLAALPQTSGEARLPLIRLLGRSASPQALAALRELLKTEDAAVQLAAVRAMAEWPSAEVSADLLEVATRSRMENQRVLAMRGYVRIVTLPSDRLAAQTATMLADAMAVARPQEKKLVLAGASTVPTLESLKLVLPYLDDSALSDEAAAAAVTIAQAIDKNEPDAAEAAANKVLQVCQNERIREGASLILRSRVTASEFIADWLVSPAYTQEGKGASALFDIAFPPETDSSSVKWTRLRSAEPVIDLLSANLGGDQRVAYLKTRIWSPRKQDAYLDMGSDDGIKAWVNGAVVHANNVDRGHAIGQDRAKITLTEGWNTLLLKVTQGGGGWAASARLRGLDEKRIDQLKVRPVEAQ